MIIAIVAQNADSAGESRSMMMHQIRSTIGITK